MRKRVFLIMALAMVVLAHAGTIRRVSLAWDGSQANDSCYFSSISADGRYVVFYSTATNLVPGDTNGMNDVFLRDLVLETTVRVSVGDHGQQANGYSYYGQVSADGRYVAFKSNSNNLVPGDSNNGDDIFLRDLVAGTTTLVSLDPDGRQFTAFSVYSPQAILLDGRQVVFTASYKRPGDQFNRTYAFVRDLAAGSTRFLSYIDNNQTIFPYGSLRFSRDGRYLAHNDSSGVHLVDFGNNSVLHVSEFIPTYPRCWGGAANASLEKPLVMGPPQYACFWNCALAADGSLIFINYNQEYGFYLINSRNYVQENGGALIPLGDVGLIQLSSSSFANDLRHVAVQKNSNLYMLDWLTGSMTLIDNYGGLEAEFAADVPLLAFYSSSSLVSEDTNGVRDVYVYQFGEIPPPVVSITISGSIKDEQGRGVEGVKLEFNPGGSTTSTSSGQYAMKLFSPWNGTITPFRTATQFVPPKRSLADVTTYREGEDFLALLATPRIAVERREDHSWMRRKSYNRVMMTVVNETTWAVTSLRLYRSKGSAAEELVRQFLPAELKDNQVTFDDLGIVASGTYQYRFWVDLANGDSISSAVVPDRN